MPLNRTISILNFANNSYFHVYSFIIPNGAAMKSILVILALLISVQLNADFPILIGKTGMQSSKCLATDSDNNIITASTFSDKVDLEKPDGTFLELYSLGQFNILLTKHDSQGNLVWGKVIEGQDIWATVENIKTDSEDNVIVCGSFKIYPEQSAPVIMDLDPGPGKYEIQADGGFDGFIAKYTPEGEILWGLAIGSIENDHNDYAWDLDIDYLNNIYVTGVFSEEADFDPLGPGNIQNANNEPGFVGYFLAKYNPDGENYWAQSFIPRMEDGSDTYSSIEVDDFGFLYFAGNFASYMDLGDSEDMAWSNGGTDIFISIYDEDGFYFEHFIIGGKKDEYIYNGGFELGTDYNMFIAGQFLDSIDINPDIYEFEYLENNLDTLQPFIAVLDYLGSYNWGFKISSNNKDSRLITHSMTFDLFGNVYIGGSFNGNFDLDPTDDIKLISSNPSIQNAFLAKYSLEGNYVWSIKIGDDFSSYTYVLGLTTDWQDDIVSAGQFSGNIDFNPLGGVPYNLSSLNSSSGFICKYNWNGILYGSTTPTGIEIKLPVLDSKWLATNEETILFELRGEVPDELIIEYSSNGGDDWSEFMRYDQALQGENELLVNAPDISSDNCLLKISDAGDPSIFEISDKFRIERESTKVLNLVAPNGMEQFNAGQKISIQYICSGVETVILEYTTDNGSAWNLLEENNVDDGEHFYFWTPGNIHSTACRVKITDKDDTSIWDQSNDAFTIGNPNSVEENESIVKIYPQPAGDFIVFELRDTFEDRIVLELFNQAGSSVMKNPIKAGINNISTANLGNGSYYYTIKSAKGILVKGKIQVTR